MKSNNLVNVKDVELTHNVYEAEGKSYGQETRERNESQRVWKKRGVEPPPTREEIRRQANEAEAQRVYNSEPEISGDALLTIALIIVIVVLGFGVFLGITTPSERQKFLNAHPECKLISEEEMPEERVYCGKACTRPAVLETYQCGTRIKRLLN